MKYEKPEMIEVGMSEGVYAASGGGYCDCFYVGEINEHPAPGSNYYSMEFNVHLNEGHSHVVETEWANMVIEITFNKDVSAAMKVRPDNCTVSGSKITFHIGSISPAYDNKYAGQYSYHFISISGEGAGDLLQSSIVVRHV